MLTNVIMENSPNNWSEFLQSIDVWLKILSAKLKCCVYLCAEMGKKYKNRKTVVSGKYFTTMQLNSVQTQISVNEN